MTFVTFKSISCFANLLDTISCNCAALDRCRRPAMLAIANFRVFFTSECHAISIEIAASMTARRYSSSHDTVLGNSNILCQFRVPVAFAATLDTTVVRRKGRLAAFNSKQSTRAFQRLVLCVYTLQSGPKSKQMHGNPQNSMKEHVNSLLCESECYCTLSLS